VIKKLEKLCRKGLLYNFGDSFAMLYSLRLLIEGTPCIQIDLVMTQNTESILTRQQLLDETYLGSSTRVQSLSRPSNSLYRLQQSIVDIR
jgi:hypothetical protein